MRKRSAYACDPQTFKAADEGGEKEEEVQTMDHKSPSIMSFSESSLHQRKSTKATSFIGSEGEKEVVEKNQKKKEKTEEVRWTEGTQMDKGQKGIVCLFCFNETLTCSMAY